MGEYSILNDTIADMKWPAVDEAAHVHAEEFETSMIMRWYRGTLDPSVVVKDLVPVAADVAKAIAAWLD
jgi:hypothetical protein